MNILQFVCLLFTLKAIEGNSQSSIQRPGLGRPFTLGSFYDIRTDTLVHSGFKFWTHEKLAENVLEREMPNSNIKIVATNSFHERAESLNVEDEVKLSYISGLMDVSGAAKYLSENSESNYIAEVFFRYRQRTHMRELTMAHLARIDYPELFDKLQGVTHIVTRIEYGANVILQFSKKANSRSKRVEMEGKLSQAMSKIAETISGSPSLFDRETLEKEEFSTTSVKFIGDVKLEKPPTTFKDAIKIFKQLPSMINKNTSIPLLVYLVPLSQLDTKASRIVRGISSELITEVEERVNSYDKLTSAIGDLQTEKAYHQLPIFRDQVDDFKRALRTHSRTFRKNLLDILPKIRGGGLEEIALIDALDENNMRYPMDELNEWVQSKQREAGALTTLTKWNPYNHSDIFVIKPGSFENLLYDTDVDYVVSFTIYLYQEKDPFTQCIKRNCEEGDMRATCKRLKCQDHLIYISWLENRTAATMLHAKFNKYQELVEFNSDWNSNGRNTVFIVREQSITDYPRIAIEIYKHTQQIKKNFAFPKIKNIKMGQNGCKRSVTWKVDGTIFKEIKVPSFDFKNFFRMTKRISIREAIQTALAEMPFSRLNSRLNGISAKAVWMASLKPDLLVGNTFVVKHRELNSKVWMWKRTSENKISLSSKNGLELVVGAVCKFGICSVASKDFPKADTSETCASRILLNGGGLSSQSPSRRLSSFELYYPRNPSLNRILNVKMLRGLEGSISGIINGRKVVIAGGNDGRTRTSATQLLNLNSNSIASGASMLKVRGYPASAVLNGTVYVCGGQDRQRRVLNSCEKLVYNKKPHWEFIKPMNYKTHAFGMVEEDNTFYVMGGVDRKPSNRLSRFIPHTDTWYSLTPMKTARYGLAAAALNGYIYACGGRVNSKHYLSLCERYDPRVNQWSNVASMTTNRYQFNLIPFDGKLYALGGRSERQNAMKTVESYDTHSDSWTREEPLTVQRAYSGAVVLGLGD